MRRSEGPEASEVLGDKEYAIPKYRRIGYVDQGRKSDKLAQYAFSLLPGADMPPRFNIRSREAFLAKFGDLGAVVWSRSASSHLLILKGYYVFRIWTATGNPVTDIADPLIGPMRERFDVSDEVGPGIYRKITPMKRRITLSTEEDVDFLVLHAINTYREPPC